MNRTATILLVEDNPGDVELARENLSDAKFANSLHVAGDGLQALAFLRRQAGFEDAPRPDVILLDLDLPRMDGRQFLAEMKADPDLMTIPVVILSSSDAEADVAATYKLGAACYVCKPVDLASFARIVRAIEGFWFSIVRLPAC